MMKKILLAAACLILLTPLYGGVNSEVRQGNKLYQKGKYGAALSKYEQALQADPHNQSAAFGAGAAAYYLKDYQTAAKTFEQAAQEQGPLNQDAQFNLGNAHYRAGDKNAAIYSYKQAILQNPQDKEAIHNLQIVLQQDQNQQNQNNQNDQNQNQNSQNQDKQDPSEQKGAAPQEQPNAPQQPEPNPQPAENQLDKQAAQRLMQLARDNEYKKPTRPGQSSDDETVEKDW